jgi:predicted RNA polymerase sigma factor
MEDLLRDLAPQVLGAVVRRYGHFDTAEDAVQEALTAATTQWPVDGVPDNPKAWLVTVAARRLTDLLCAEQARHRREAEHRPVPTGGVSRTTTTPWCCCSCAATGRCRRRPRSP